jgi:hypothetical protein
MQSETVPMFSAWSVTAAKSSGRSNFAASGRSGAYRFWVVKISLPRAKA